MTLGVRDLARSLAFYRDGLGWPPSSSSNENIAFFTLPGSGIALFEREALATDAGVPMPPTPAPPVTLAYLVRGRDEVEPLLEHVRALGVGHVGEPIERHWGGFSGYFADPDGFLWEVAHNPFVALAEDGTVRLPA